jgi:excinuclease ABC subunit C
MSKGALRGPVLFSVIGIRHPNEASGSSSLFAQPVLNLDAVPLEGSVVMAAARDELEQRLEVALSQLAPPETRRGTRGKKSGGDLADYLCLFSRWYYRPLAKRTGEIVFAGEDGKTPSKAVLRAVSRVWVKSRQQQTLAHGD